MRTTFISSRSMTETMRLTLLKSQQQLGDAQKEATTGRHADIGLALGYKTGQVVSLRQDFMRLKSIEDSNGVANLRLDATQLTLTAAVKQGNDYLSSLITYAAMPTQGALAQTEAKAGLVAFSEKLNATSDGAYLLAGINSDVKPIDDYYAPGATSRASVQAAFTTAFGATPPEQITPAQMQAFLDGPFAALFADPAWGANWSNASDQNIRSRISTRELIDTSTNANEQVFRNMVQAFTMVADLSTSQLQPATFKIVADKAAKLVSSAATGMATLQGVVGVAEERIEASNERMSLQRSVIQNQINALEGVDYNEASLRVSALTDQIELSYAITGKLQSLNILDYL